MKFKVNGVELDASNMRVREVCDAEQALGIDMGETGAGGKTAVALFIAMRRAEPDKPVRLLADEVMNANMETFEEVEEDGPPVEAPVAEERTGDEAPESQQTGGPRRLEASA